jgi:hypothetical protein
MYWETFLNTGDLKTILKRISNKLQYSEGTGFKDDFFTLQYRPHVHLRLGLDLSGAIWNLIPIIDSGFGCSPDLDLPMNPDPDNLIFV